jgi:hypothetical protein
MNDNDKKGIWIYDYLYSIEDFNLNDIIIYSIIKGFCSNGKMCYATNSYFAQKIKKNNDTARKSITKLFEKGYIVSAKDFNHKSNRVLTITDKIDSYLKSLGGLLENNRIPLVKNNRVPLVKISNNNINNKKENNINNNKENNIYISFKAYQYLKNNYRLKIDEWEKQNKNSISNYSNFLEYFEIKVEEEQIELSLNKLLGRLSRLKYNWKPRDSFNSYDNLPVKKFRRIN